MGIQIELEARTAECLCFPTDGLELHAEAASSDSWHRTICIICLCWINAGDHSV